MKLARLFACESGIELGTGKSLKTCLRMYGTHDEFTREDRARQVYLCEFLVRELRDTVKDVIFIINIQSVHLTTCFSCKVAMDIFSDNAQIRLINQPNVF